MLITEDSPPSLTRGTESSPYDHGTGMDAMSLPITLTFGTIAGLSRRVPV